MTDVSRTRRIVAGLAVALGLAGATLAAAAQDYDLVNLNGRVIDPETMLDATLNVGVKEGAPRRLSAPEQPAEECLRNQGESTLKGKST